MPLKYQVVAYDWSDKHWINKQISAHTKSNINHIGVRFQIGGSSYETFIGPKRSDNFVYTRSILRKYGPPKIISDEYSCSYDEVTKCIEIAEKYKTASVVYPYIWWYTGKIMPVPRSCTDLTWRCLKVLGYDVKERAIPSQLLKEFYLCLYL